MLILGILAIFIFIPPAGPISYSEAPVVKAVDLSATEPLAVPFYSQFSDISSPSWQGLGCGVASLAMIVDFYNSGPVSVDAILEQGIASGAFIDGAGWSHQDLVNLSKKYGLTGQSYDFSNLSGTEAFTELENALQSGPVIASVHYTLKPTNPIPHLIVINSLDGELVHYNDPAESGPGNSISAENFITAWKRRFIIIRPIENYSNS